MLMCCCSTPGDCCFSRFKACGSEPGTGGPLEVLYLTATMRKEFQTFALMDAGSFITHTGTMRRVSTTWYPQCSGGYHPAGGITGCLWLSDETFTVRSGDWSVGRCPGSVIGSDCMDPTLHTARLFFMSGGSITDFTNDDGCFYESGGYGYDETGECYAGYLRAECDVSNCSESVTGPTGGPVDVGKSMILQGKLIFSSCNPLYAVASRPCQEWRCGGGATMISRTDYVSYVLSE